jgi:uncharacterized protein YjbI with pentapeptide repeats
VGDQSAKVLREYEAKQRCLDDLAVALRERDDALATSEAWAHTASKAANLLHAAEARVRELEAALDTQAKLKRQNLRRAEWAERQVAALREALEPFAKLAASNFWSADGSEGDLYEAFLFDGPAEKADFSGADLARARAALKGEDHG